MITQAVLIKSPSPFFCLLQPRWRAAAVSDALLPAAASLHAPWGHHHDDASYRSDLSLAGCLWIRGHCSNMMRCLVCCHAQGHCGSGTGLAVYWMINLEYSVWRRCESIDRQLRCNHCKAVSAIDEVVFRTFKEVLVNKQNHGSVTSASHWGLLSDCVPHIE